MLRPALTTILTLTPSLGFTIKLILTLIHKLAFILILTLVLRHTHLYTYIVGKA